MKQSPKTSFLTNLGLNSQNGQVPQAPPRRLPAGRSHVNTDPGVYEPGDPYKANFTEYPDQEDFLNQLRASAQQFDLTYPVPKEFIGGAGMATLLEDGREGDAAQNGESSELPADEAPVATAPADLPLANDYQGIGGPSSVPLYSPDAFERPDVTPHLNCILDDLFLAPSPQQLRAYQRVLSRQEM